MVDASIMPLQVNIHLSAALCGVSEKAADQSNSLKRKAICMKISFASISVYPLVRRYIKTDHCLYLSYAFLHVKIIVLVHCHKFFSETQGTIDS